MTAESTQDDGAGAPRFTVLSGNPTASELAAVTAVLAAMAEELGNDHTSAPEYVRSAWSHSQRPIRRPIMPGPGAWQRFFA